MTDRVFRKTKFIWILLLMICVLTGCGKKAAGETTSMDQLEEKGQNTGTMVESPEEAEVPELKDFSDLEGKTVSMLTGAPFEELVKSKAPGVAKFTTYNNNPDMVLALKSGKTDAVLSNNAVITLAVNRNKGLVPFPQHLQDGVF